MKVTNNYRGTKPLIWLLILAISPFFGVFSCSKTASEPEKYQINVQNNYFEPVSVTIDGFFSENLTKEGISNTFFLPKGKHLIVCTTQSRLKIENSVTLQGSQERILISITPKGKIVIAQQ